MKVAEQVELAARAAGRNGEGRSDACLEVRLAGEVEERLPA
jgi:hypothetical protein